MIPALSLFEAHLNVSDLDRAIHFYREVLGLTVARQFPERQVAFFWVGTLRHSMLGLWAGGYGPQRMSLHVAFQVELADLLEVIPRMKTAGIAPLGFDTRPADEPDVLAWMPAASVYFRDPDGNLLEYLAWIDGPPAPDLGILPWSAWTQHRGPR